MATDKDRLEEIQRFQTLREFSEKHGRVEAINRALTQAHEHLAAGLVLAESEFLAPGERGSVRQVTKAWAREELPEKLRDAVTHLKDTVEVLEIGDLLYAIEAAEELRFQLGTYIEETLESKLRTKGPEKVGSATAESATSSAS